MRLGVAARSSRTTAKEQLEGAAERHKSMPKETGVKSKLLQEMAGIPCSEATFGVRDAPETKKDDGRARAGFVRRS